MQEAGVTVGEDGAVRMESMWKGRELSCRDRAWGLRCCGNEGAEESGDSDWELGPVSGWTRWKGWQELWGWQQGCETSFGIRGRVPAHPLPIPRSSPMAVPLQYQRHLFVHISQHCPSPGAPPLESVDVRQIYDKFPEKKGGLRELYDRGPPHAFFLVKFWVSSATKTRSAHTS